MELNLDNCDMDVEQNLAHKKVSESLVRSPFDLTPLLLEEAPYWEYHQRRMMQQILPGLYLGPYAAACKSKRQELVDAGITHIVCVRLQEEANLIRPNFPDTFIYMTVDLRFDRIQSMIPLFYKVNAFIDDALKRNGRVLVHGNNGCFHSPVFVIAYIIARTGMSPEDACDYVKTQRQSVNKSDEVIKQLTEFAPVALVPYQMKDQVEIRPKVTRQIEHCFPNAKRIFTGSQ